MISPCVFFSLPRRGWYCSMIVSTPQNEWTKTGLNKKNNHFAVLHCSTTMGEELLPKVFVEPVTQNEPQVWLTCKNCISFNFLDYIQTGSSWRTPNMHGMCLKLGRWTRGFSSYSMLDSFKMKGCYGTCCLTLRLVSKFICMFTLTFGNVPIWLAHMLFRCVAPTRGVLRNHADPTYK